MKASLKLQQTIGEYMLLQFRLLIDRTSRNSEDCESAFEGFNRYSFR